MAELKNTERTELASAEPMLKSVLRAARPHQWLKNILIFLPILASHNVNLHSVTQAILAFVAFSLVASSVYVTNDLLDVEADRLHPRKRFRPFASGALTMGQGRVMALVLAAAGLSVALVVGPAFLVVWVTYLIITIAYSTVIKRIVILDIFVLSILYCVRIAAGGAATAVEISQWLFSFSIFVFFFLASIKRLAEIRDHAARGLSDIPGRGYRIEDRDSIAMIAVGTGFVSVVVLALYISSPAVISLYQGPVLLWGACLTLMYWVTHIVFVTNRDQMHDDPIVFALKDPTSLVCLVIVGGCAGTAVSLPI